MIYVAPGADKTDGYQANRNLGAEHQGARRFHPRPGDFWPMTCAARMAPRWGDRPDQVFYLLSRGIEQREAERLIVEGIFRPDLCLVFPSRGVRQRFQQAIHEKMESYTR